MNTMMRVTGGTAQHPLLTKRLQATDPREYAMGKAVFWANLLRNGHAPDRWYAPTGKGTRVGWKTITGTVEAATALGAYRGYVAGINATYDCNWVVDLELEGTDECE